MRVAFDAVGIREGGGAALLGELIRWLPKVRRDWEWDLYLLDRPNRDFDDPAGDAHVAIHPISYARGLLGRARWIYSDLPGRLREGGADVLFSFANIGSPRPVIPQVVYCQQLLTFSTAGDDGRGPLQRLRLRVLQQAIRMGLRASSKIVVQTAWMQERIISCYPELARGVKVIPAGSRTPSPKLTVRPELKKSIDEWPRPRLVYVASPMPHKNHEALIRAMPQIIKTYSRATLLLTVQREQPAYDGRLTGKLVDLADSLGVSKNVIFAGPLSHDEVDYALKCADLLVFPSIAESFGLPLVEAMSAGCPVAAADLGYAREVAGDAAIYFDPGSAERIASAVVDVLSSETKLATLRRAAIQRSHLFEYRRIAEDIAAVLESAKSAKSVCGGDTRGVA